MPVVRAVRVSLIFQNGLSGAQGGLGERRPAAESPRADCRPAPSASAPSAGQGGAVSTRRGEQVGVRRQQVPGSREQRSAVRRGLDPLWTDCSLSTQKAGGVSCPAVRRGACRHWHGHVSVAFPRPASLLAGLSPGHPRRLLPASASAHRLEGPRSCSDGPAPESCVVPVRAVAAHLPCVWARVPGVGGTTSGALVALGAPLQPMRGCARLTRGTR